MIVKLDKKHKIASLDIDCQKGFTPLCPNELPVEGGTDIADELNRHSNFADFRIGTKDAHSDKAEWITKDRTKILSPIEGDNMDVRWPIHCVPGTKGFELIDGLPKVTEYDYFVWKGIETDMHPYGNCYHDFAEKLSTGLIEFLRNNQVSTVLAGGLTTDYCVKNTVLQLIDADFNVIVNLAACRAIAKETADIAINEMKQRGVVIIGSTSELEINAE